MIPKKRQIKIVDVTGQTIANVESTFNTNFGLKGWRIVQYFAEGTKRYVLAEREL